MSKTFLSRLAMLEVLDAAGPLTISELARRSGLDVAVVSRTVAACEGDGWLARVGGKVTIGPRATLLGHASPFADVIAGAAPLVHAVAGVTGLLTHAYSLIGASSVLIAAGPGRGPGIPPGLAARAPLHATAAGHAIAVQLDPARLDALLPPEPYPDADAVTAAMAGTAAEPFFTPARHDRGGPAAPAPPPRRPPGSARPRPHRRLRHRPRRPPPRDRLHSHPLAPARLPERPGLPRPPGGHHRQRSPHPARPRARRPAGQHPQPGHHRHRAGHHEIGPPAP